ncbi:MAG TPA: sugar phosphate isomerase/epimerase family protein [Gemmataceae bacterium]|nr:sugar phosphate isomerase/epimerase family protein [Gemmataceae bacterium]
MAVTGVQVDASGDLSPRSLSQTGRREFLHLLRAHNLELAALGCPLRHGLDVAEGQQARIDAVKRVMTLSFDLGARRVTIQAGHVPAEPDSPPARLMTEALLALGQHGDRTGSVLAIETGLESGQALRQFLERFDSGGLGVNLDPANLLLGGFNLAESVRALEGKVVFAQAKDARSAGTSRAGQEVPLGHGDIEWMEYLGLLEEIEYRGWRAILAAFPVDVYPVVLLLILILLLILVLIFFFILLLIAQCRWLFGWRNSICQNPSTSNE